MSFWAQRAGVYMHFHPLHLINLLEYFSHFSASCRIHHVDPSPPKQTNLPPEAHLDLHRMYPWTQVDTIQQQMIHTWLSLLLWQEPTCLLIEVQIKCLEQEVGRILPIYNNHLGRLDRYQLLCYQLYNSYWSSSITMSFEKWQLINRSSCSWMGTKLC